MHNNYIKMTALSLLLSNAVLLPAETPTAQPLDLSAQVSALGKNFNTLNDQTNKHYAELSKVLETLKKKDAELAQKKQTAVEEEAKFNVEVHALHEKLEKDRLKRIEALEAKQTDELRLYIRNLKIQRVAGIQSINESFKKLLESSIAKKAGALKADVDEKLAAYKKEVKESKDLYQTNLDTTKSLITEVKKAGESAATLRKDLETAIKVNDDKQAKIIATNILKEAGFMHRMRVAFKVAQGTSLTDEKTNKPAEAAPKADEETTK